MKNIIYLLIFIAVTATSCGKRCWECTVNSDGVISQEKFCDRNKKQINDMEANPWETKDKNGKVVFTTTFSNCTKK